MTVASKFLERVLQRVAGREVKDYVFYKWSVPGKPTDEGVGLLPLPGANPSRILERVMDVDGYVRNLGHVVECRAVADPRFVPPEKVRFYQRLKIPLIGEIHHELVLERAASVQGFEVACWSMLDKETEALGSRSALRSQYNDGAWLVAPGVVGYALSSAPRRSDVGLLKWTALTKGADVAASKVIRDNIESMAAWAARG